MSCPQLWVKKTCVSPVRSSGIVAGPREGTIPKCVGTVSVEDDTNNTLIPFLNLLHSGVDGSFGVITTITWSLKTFVFLVECSLSLAGWISMLIM